MKVSYAVDVWCEDSVEYISEFAKQWLATVYAEAIIKEAIVEDAVIIKRTEDKNGEVKTVILRHIKKKDIKK